jgi:hypothetical protein
MSERPHKWRDVAWKGAIVDGARDAIEYFMPDLASGMDVSKDITGITGMELPMQGSESDKGMLVSDIFLKCSRDRWRLERCLCRGTTTRKRQGLCLAGV